MVPFLTLAQIRSLLESYGAAPRKRWGQHFLFERALLGKIAAALQQEEPHVIEIGPGAGNLTSELLRAGRSVTAVEIDPVCAGYLSQFSDDRFTIIHADILQRDMDRLCGDRPASLVANIPYNITSPIIRKAAASPWISEAVLLIQDDVARRLTARPGEKLYGFLSVVTALDFVTEKLFRVPASVFYPRPRVGSAVVRLQRRHDTYSAAQKGALTAAADGIFKYRRKRLVKALRLGGFDFDVKAVEERFSPDLRGETLSVPQLVDLCRTIGTWPDG